MRTECERVEELLASEGPAALETDEAAAAHAASCDDCRPMLAAATELEAGLAALPEVDAPDGLVERLLARPELRRRSLLRSPWILSSVAAGLLLGVGAYVVVCIDVERRRAIEQRYAEVPSETRFVETFPDEDAQREYAARVDLAKRQAQLEELKDAYGKLERDVPESTTEYLRTMPPASEPPPPPPPPTAGRPGDAPAVDELRGYYFLASRSELEGNAKLDEASARSGAPSFLPHGYWANTYLPGDPRTRFLAARLAALDATARFRTWASELHDRVVPVDEPFDAPESRALSLYFDADRVGVRGPTRMIVQVGLKAAERHARRRPVMNLGLVLDLPDGLPVERAGALRAVALAFADAKEGGDRFRLLAPGRETVEPGAFDRERLAALFEDAARAAPGDSLEAALERAIGDVADAEEDDAVLGTSALVLVLTRPLGAEVAALERLAGRSAVSGIPVSVIATAGALPMEVERLALAGQGSRWLLDAPADAGRVVEAELAASSRVVARAVRLRIRLGRNVGLVNVLGSHRLDERAADRVREAERSLDERLARNLGIASDRGEDEDGIQIVIPTMYAGDTHVVLLEVVVPGPGPVGDVRARFKDIGALRNEVSRASLALASGEHPEGPLQTNVWKNRLAQRLSEALAAAGDRLARGDVAGARSTLDAAVGALRTTVAERPRLDDAEVRRDLSTLARYLAWIDEGAAAETLARDYLSTSLRYAARIKLTPPLPLQ